MALIGNIEQFQGKAEDFPTYLERMEHVFAVNAVEDQLKVSMFVTLAGPAVYQTLKNLTAPRRPQEHSYVEVTELLRKHYTPPTSEIYERFLFNQCNQKHDQGIADYIVELRKLANSCNFGQFLDEALRDRFVCGLRLEMVQKRLLTETELTFTSACQLAQAAELADKQVRTLSDNCSSSEGIHYVKKGKRLGGNNFPRGEPDKVERCRSCGRNHAKDRCPAANWRCFACNGKGHIKALCPTTKIGSLLQQEEDGSLVDSEFLYLNNVSSRVTAAHKLQLWLNDQPVVFEVDTGACKAVMSQNGFNRLFKIPLTKAVGKLHSITGKEIETVGECRLKVRYSGKVHCLVLTVIRSAREFVPLLGRNWLNKLFPNWENYFQQEKQLMNYVKEDEVAGLKEKFYEVFDLKGSEPIKDFEIKFTVKEEVKPIFRKAYSMPFALKPKVECKLKQMVSEGILKPVTQCEWASPIVVVSKKDGDVRICTDFRSTVNKAIKVDQYPLPTPEEIFASLAGGKWFTVLDLSGAYQQLRVHSDYQKFLTINTHIGMFQFTRLTYGISAAPAIFQCVMDQLLAGLPNVHCYLDDILIAAKSRDEAKLLVDQVLQRLSEKNVKVKWEKCKFYQKSVEYLGHVIDEDGIHPTDEKLKAIREAPVPSNLTQLRAYLGLINYYNKFVPRLATELKPLYQLLEKDRDFIFDDSCKAAFAYSKDLMTGNNVLVHYDPHKTLVLICDASSYGVGGVLCHREGGRERPVLFVSGTLSKAEQNYSQIEREALAIIFCMKKLHKYLYGRKFILVSDHAPLKTLFNPDKSMPVTAASRIVRWNIFLSAYNYQLEYRKGKQLYEADMLSRLPLPQPTKVDSYINSFNLTDNLPLTYEDIAKETDKDSTLRKVREYIRMGWPNHTNEDTEKAFFSKRNDLSLEKECIMLGVKVVIPESLRKTVLNLLHEDHTGIVRTKMLARSTLWWPGLQRDLEQLVTSCSVCQASQNATEKFLMSWPKTERVFERVHIDFFWREGRSYLIVVDSKSKWIDVHPMHKGTSAIETIEKLKVTFAVMGLPNIIVSDNGPPFNSDLFLRFCQVNGIVVLKTPPYHPQSNGTAERHVQIVKVALNKYLLQKSALSIEQQLVNFLFSYRNTPCASTGLSSNEYIFKNKPRTRLDLLKPSSGNGNPSFGESLERKNPATFIEGEKVWVGKLGPNIKEKFRLGTIIKPVSRTMYLVEVDRVGVYKHVNSLHKFVEKATNSNTTETAVPMPALRYPVCKPMSDKVIVNTKERVPQTDNVYINIEDKECKTAENIEEAPYDARNTIIPEQCLRRSERSSKAPQRLNL